VAVGLGANRGPDPSRGAAPDDSKEEALAVTEGATGHRKGRRDLRRGSGGPGRTVGSAPDRRW